MLPESDRSAELLPVTAQRRFPLPLVLGVISDTHIQPHGRRQMPEGVLDLFERFRVDLLVHTGDLCCEDVLERLAEIAPVIAVPGNADNGFLRQTLPDEVRFMAGRYRIGVIHGHQSGTARQTASVHLAGDVDLGIYGHSHEPKIDEIDGTILFNPGSATDRRWNEYLGVGIITLTDEKIHPDLVLFRDPAHLVNIRP